MNRRWLNGNLRFFFLFDLVLFEQLNIKYEIKQRKTFLGQKPNWVCNWTPGVELRHWWKNKIKNEIRWTFENWCLGFFFNLLLQLLESIIRKWACTWNEYTIFSVRLCGATKRCIRNLNPWNASHVDRVHITVAYSCDWCVYFELFLLASSSSLVVFCLQNSWLAAVQPSSNSSSGTNVMNLISKWP